MKENMLITEVIRPACINLSLKATTKDEVITEMADMFDASGVLASKEDFIKDVYAREAEGPTGIGGGVAIPHGKSDGVITTSMAVGRTLTDIHWESLDDEPVRVFVMFAVNSGDKSQLVSLLSQVAVALCDDEIIARLFKSKQAEEIIHLFSNKGVTSAATSYARKEKD